MLRACLDYRPPHQHILQPLAERARSAPKSRSIVLVREDDCEEILSADELLTACVARARGLRGLGFEPGDVVLLGLGHGVDLVATFLGCLYAGIVPTISAAYVSEGQPIDAHAKRLSKIAEAAGAKALIAAPTHAEALAQVGWRVVTTTQLGVAGGSVSLREPQSGGLAFLQYTSGSERVVVVCEMAVRCGDDDKLRIEREVRRRSIQRLDVSLSDVRLVDKGWILKTSSGKHARSANREKYLRETSSSRDDTK